VADARQTPTEKWTNEFMRGFAGKAVVFDAAIFPDRDHRVRLDYELIVNGNLASIEINNIEELATWVSPHQDAQRWLFGVRLAKIDLKSTPDIPDGQWTVHFHPDSIELITEPGLLRFLDLSQQSDLPGVMRRQKKLVAWESPEITNPRDIKPGTSVESVNSFLGPPSRIARQILSTKYLEQRIYDKPQPLRLRFERRRGEKLRVVGARCCCQIGSFLI
jgi:hypothetical protein